MKRSIVSLLQVPVFVVPLVIGAIAVDPLAGPGLRAQAGTCTRKATAVGGEIHCHEEGTNCKITCPVET